MKCKDIMTPDPVCCLPGASAVEAAEIMKNDGIGSVPVVEDLESKRLAGIVTDRDLALEVVAAGKDPRSVLVGEVMKSAVITCEPSDEVKTVITRMADQQIRRVPVIDGNGSVIGIIAQSDVATRLDEPETTGEMVEEISR
jgi:CBS domain-containing protein